KGRPGERGDNWLLIKERDEFARPGSDDAILHERPESVATGRRIEELPSPDEAAPGVQTRLALGSVAGAVRSELIDVPGPQLAQSAEQAPAGEEWLHEIKFDGYRTLVRIDGEAVRL